jgi:hypothetical protein
MKIAILEICTHTHYSAINGLIKTYSTDPNNSVTLYTNESIAKAIKENAVSDKTEIVLFEKGQNVANFLRDIEHIHYDRLHICTIEGFYKEFGKFKPYVNEIVFHVHDIDIWFDSTTKNTLKNYMFTVKNKPNVVRETAKFLRDVLVRNKERNRILSNILKRKHRFIVHSTGQQKYLSEFVDAKDIIIFPFAINEGLEKPVFQATKTKKIRICIPGIVTDTRRDYTGLFKILENNLPAIKDKLVFDFLGFVEKSEPELLQKIEKLEQDGLEVIYYTDFVFGKKFDSALEKADILLNNQKVVTSHTTKYGVSKESGMLFNMIRGSKPGILPKAYGVDKEFEEAVIYYESDKELTNVLLGLATGRIPLEKYKKEATVIGHNYTPPNLYGRLVNSGVPV